MERKPEQQRMLPIERSAASAIALGMLREKLEEGEPIEFVSLGIKLVKEGDKFVIKNFPTEEVIGKPEVAPKPI